MTLTGWEIFLEAAIKVVVVFALLLNVTIFLVWIERKLIADMQNRVGPMRAGPFGLLQTVADGVKLIFKENVTPNRARTQLLIYLAAPVAALVPAFLIFLAIPIGRPFMIGDREITMAAIDLNIGLLFILAVSSLAVYAVVLAGWSSGSKYPLLGGVRASAQMISYEAAMGLALVPVILFTGTTSVTGIVDAQAGGTLGFLGVWNVVLIPSFIIFFISAVAETNRPPFDLVEAESELVGGFFTEYSGFRFAMFFLAEYVNMFNMSALTVTLFFGGWHGPTFGLGAPFDWILPIVWFFAKTLFFVCVFIWIRASLPRMRYDQLMGFGWKRLIPVSLMWIALATVAIAVRRFGLPWA